MLKENVIFVSFVSFCTMIGVLYMQSLDLHDFGITTEEWEIVALKCSIILFLLYSTITTLCIIGITKKYEITLILRVLLLFIYFIIIYYIPNRYIAGYYGPFACGISLVWLLLQGVHYLDNSQILHNFMVMNLLNIRTNEEQTKAESKKWIYMHLSTSACFMILIMYLCMNINAVFRTANLYNLHCLDPSEDPYSVVEIYNGVIIYGIVIVLLSLPKFTNKGLFIPLSLFTYQLYIILIIMSLKMNTCNNDIVIDDPLNSNVVDKMTYELQKNTTFVQNSLVLLSLMYIVIILWYNLSTPNMKTLLTIVRGSLCNYMLMNDSEYVQFSLLMREKYAPSDDPEHPNPLNALQSPERNGKGRDLGEREHLLNDGTHYGSIARRSDIPLRLPHVVTADDVTAAPVPVFYIYFTIITCYLPLFLTGWNIFIAPEKDAVTPDMITNFDSEDINRIHIDLGTMILCLFIVQMLLYVFYTIALFNAYRTI